MGGLTAARLVSLELSACAVDPVLAEFHEIIVLDVGFLGGDFFSRENNRAVLNPPIEAAVAIEGRACEIVSAVVVFQVAEEVLGSGEDTSYLFAQRNENLLRRSLPPPKEAT
jgi:hypothetical protein